MSTSLMYHAFGAKTYDYVKTEYRDGAIHFHVGKKPHHRRCVVCRSRDVTLGGVETYSLRTVPIGGRAVFLVLELHILRCTSCGALRQESRDVAEARKSYTRAFARYVIELSRQMTMVAIARHLGVGWDLVKEIIKHRLSKRAKRRSWRKVRRIAIDEIAVRKGYQYMTVVLDLDTGEVLYTALGKDQKALEGFFARLRRARAKLEAIAVDMSQAYASAIKEYWPGEVAIVHDHYHVVSNMNEVIDKVRRDEQNRLEGEGGMSRPLLKFGGGSDDILRDLLFLHRLSEAEALISGTERRDQLRHIGTSPQAPEAFGRFEDAGGDPTQHHLASAPALDVAFYMAGSTDEALGGVGGGQ